jgi:hypothetical protein
VKRSLEHQYLLRDMYPEYLKLAKEVLGQEISAILLEPGDYGL